MADGRTPNKDLMQEAAFAENPYAPVSSHKFTLSVNEDSPPISDSDQLFLPRLPYLKTVNA
jgi:hypothetical protein